MWWEIKRSGGSWVGSLNKLQNQERRKVSSMGWGRLLGMREEGEAWTSVVSGVMWKRAWLCNICLIWWTKAVGGLRGMSTIN